MVAFLAGVFLAGAFLGAVFVVAGFLSEFLVCFVAGFFVGVLALSFFTEVAVFLAVLESCGFLVAVPAVDTAFVTVFGDGWGFVSFAGCVVGPASVLVFTGDGFFAFLSPDAIDL